MFASRWRAGASRGYNTTTSWTGCDGEGGREGGRSWLACGNTRVAAVELECVSWAASTCLTLARYVVAYVASTSCRQIDRYLAIWHFDPAQHSSGTAHGNQTWGMFTFFTVSSEGVWQLYISPSMQWPWRRLATNIQTMMHLFPQPHTHIYISCRR
jgi:hypothetical protein